MGHKPRAFLDTSALFAGIWSSEGGARFILKLGEAGAIQLVVNTLVLTEIERTLRAKSPGSLGPLALLLDRCQVEIISAGEGSLLRAQSLVAHPGDAQIIASALESKIEFLITLDRKHFVDNLDLCRAVDFRVGTPGDFLAWYRSYIQGLATDM
jgi:predicted nucleic acid-binding protein